MAEPQPSQPNRHLSEISHLFLDSVRDRQTNGAPRPVRRPPGEQRDISIDLTPEEFAQAFGGEAPDDEAQTEGACSAPAAERLVGISALVSAHLNGRQHERVRHYARYLARQGRRIGLIEVDAAEFRLSCFDRATHAVAPMPEAEALDCFDERQMTDALEELNWDVDHWLLVLPTPRLLEARALLREIDHWVLLCTGDHDGVVSGYRMLKGLGDMNPAGQRPRLSVALLEAADALQADRIHRKLAGVCQQFLAWPVGEQMTVDAAPAVAEHPILCCRPTRDKAQMAQAPQWRVVGDFLAKARLAAASAAEAALEQDEEHSGDLEPPMPTMNSARQRVADLVVPMPAPALAPEAASTPAPDARSVRPASPVAAPAAFTLPQPPVPMAREPQGGLSEVIDLSDIAASEGAMLGAILQHRGSDLAECPVRPPMCPEARLAVARDRRLVLVAAARQGLHELGAIGQAYRWLIENRGLIAMAIPQFAVDAHAMPMLRLFVDQSDLAADILHPLLEAGHVQVQPYRKLRWGEKTGLLLEAA